MEIGKTVKYLILYKSTVEKINFKIWIKYELII